jgi:hypothetical protein
LVTGTSWNWNGDIQCSSSGLYTVEQFTTADTVAKRFTQFNMIITTDEGVYLQTDKYRRQRVIVTEHWEWYGKSGGVSFKGSAFTGTETPCFVFSTLLGYNLKKISDAIAHEIGHCIGLPDQPTYDVYCRILNGYNIGFSPTGPAPIMGNSYSSPYPSWWINRCTNLNDSVFIRQKTQ